MTYGNNLVHEQNPTNTKGSWEAKIDMSNLPSLVRWQYLSKKIVDIWKDGGRWENIVDRSNLPNAKSNSWHLESCS